MRSIIGLLAFSLCVGILYSWASRPDAEIGERTVLTTSVYALMGGAITNNLCAIIVRQVHAVEPGEEMGACSPYGLVGAGVSARLHLYWINGYGPAEWEYVRSVPSRSVDYARHGVDTLLGFGGVESQQPQETLLRQDGDL